MTIKNTPYKPLFSTGVICATPGAIDACGMGYIVACLIQHTRGDWGVIGREDRQINDAAVKHGDRILSAYPIDAAKPSRGYGDNTLWLITEADRSATTALLPDEY